MREPDYPSRVHGCLLGGAIGDAFGYEVEFDRLAAIHKRFGPLGLLEPVRHRGRLVVSDDTQMTLFTLEGLNRARSAGCLADLDATLEHIRLATLDWYRTQSSDAADARYTGTLGRSRVLQARRAPGNTCLSACALGAWGTPERPINDSKGCGGVMRVAPIGLMRGLSREYTAAQAFELASRAAAQTHGHPEGYLPAGALAAIVRGLVEGLGLAEAASVALGLLRGMPRSGRTVEALLEAQAAGASVASLGEGWVGEEALAVGYHAALVGGGFAGAVRLAANHDGDSDSTASIAGQILGAALGVEAIPAGWGEGLDCGVELSELGNGLLGGSARPGPPRSPA